MAGCGTGSNERKQKRITLTLQKCVYQKERKW